MAIADDLDRLVDTVTLETVYTPPVVIPRPFAPSAGGAVSTAARILRPRLTFTLRPGLGGPVVVAPYGVPEPNEWPAVQGAATLLGGLAIAGVVYWSLRQWDKRRK